MSRTLSRPCVSVCRLGSVVYTPTRLHGSQAKKETSPHRRIPSAFQRMRTLWLGTDSVTTQRATLPEEVKPLTRVMDKDYQYEAPIEMPRRLVDRWFIPVVTTTTRVVSSEAPSMRAAEPKDAKTAAKSATEKAAASLAATTSTAATANTNSNGSDSVGVERKEPAATATPPPPGAVTSGTIPQALIDGQRRKNNAIKKLLMASLGSGFASAGIHSDGVRTSFSSMNYQTLKQITGLKHIPPKLVVSCLQAPGKAFNWIDISSHPTATLSEYREAIVEVLEALGVDALAVEESAESMLLPQVTVLNHSTCLVLRYAIEAPPNKRMDSFQDLTNRFTMYFTDKQILTVHRSQCTFVEELKRTWGTTMVEESQNDGRAQFLLYYIVRETVGTFTKAISKCIIEFDQYEAGLFTTSRNRSALAREIYHIKRRAAVYARALRLTQDAFSHAALSMRMHSVSSRYQEVQHDLSHVESLAEELNANADSVLQLLFQLSSYQVNELMRVLTLFSAFFIPLSFIASAFGMNFENIPLLKHPYGEFYCGGIMCFVAGGIFLWFKAKHFI